jgi:hypothetical protein
MNELKTYVFKKPAKAEGFIEEDRVILENGVAKGAELKFRSPNLFLTINGGPLRRNSMVDASYGKSGYYGPKGAWVELNANMDKRSSLIVPAGVLCLGPNISLAAQTEIVYGGECFVAPTANADGVFKYTGNDEDFHATEINGQRIFVPGKNGLPDLDALWGQGRLPSAPQLPTDPGQWRRPEGL